MEGNFPWESVRATPRGAKGKSARGFFLAGHLAPLPKCTFHLDDVLASCRRDGHKEVVNLRPFTSRDLAIRGLADRKLYSLC